MYTADASGEILVQLGKALFFGIESGLGSLDLWWSRKFGHALSGRFGKLEIQTLFHGNTRDQDPI